MNDMIDFSAPLAGMERATTSLNQTASKIANLSTPGDTVDLSSEVVSLLQSRNSFESNTKVLQTEDEMTKSLLNMIG
jgi:flagellar basal body rod protein FlgG